MPLESMTQKNEGEIKLMGEDSSGQDLIYFVQYGELDGQGNTIRTVARRIKVPKSLPAGSVTIPGPVGCVNIKTVTAVGP